MIALLHGYLLEGSGSNLWTRAVVRALCRMGETVHLISQEGRPEDFDFISDAHLYHADGSVEAVLRRDVPYPGRCIAHRPMLGDTLPVYVPDRYQDFNRVVSMVELSDHEIEAYLERNVNVALRVVLERGVSALHANHAVLMPVVARRVLERTGVPFAVMPHGSALEYAVKPDPRFHRHAAGALARAGRILVIGDEMRRRVLDIFPALEGLEERMRTLNLGVDTELFEPIPHERRERNVRRLAAGLAAEPRASDHHDKLPDPGVEAALASVDWRRDPVILFVGRLIAAKGVHSVVGAMPLIAERHPDARLVVVGHGPLRARLEEMLAALGEGERERFLALAGDLPELRHFLGGLEERGDLEGYFEAGRRLAGRVLFTGYLTHEQLRHLFPCADVAVFPSIVREAGPLVFLEALACGVFPLGTYFGGMAASIDAAAAELPPEAAAWMKLRPDPEHLVDDVVRGTCAALDRPHAFAADLRRLAERDYDWSSVAERLRSILMEMGEEGA